MFEDVPLFLLPLPGPVPGLQQPSAAVKAVSSLHHITYTSLSLPVQFQNGGLCFFLLIGRCAELAGWQRRTTFPLSAVSFDFSSSQPGPAVRS